MSREHPIAPSDTVPAMLTPGEAVLNKEAADLVGRGVIAALNQKGLNMRHKGIVPVHGFADGVNEVQKPVSAAPAQNASLSPGWSTPAVGVGGDYYAQRANQIMQSGGTEPAPTKSQSPSALSMGGTTVSKQGTSYSQASAANSTTGLTPVGGGTNAQSLVNQATQLTPPMVGLPGQGTTGTSNEAASTQAQTRKQVSAPPAVKPMDLWSDTELTQGFANGVAEVKPPKLGDLDAMRNAANQIKYADMANKPANVTHGFGDADPYAPEPKQFKPSSGGTPEGEYRAKFTMGGKDMSAPEPSKALVPVGERGIVAKATNAGLATQSPVQKAIVPVANNLPATVAPKSTGIVPVGQSWHNTVEPEVEKVQMRGAPSDWYANTSEGKASRMTEEMGKAAGYKPPKIDPTMAEKMAESAKYTPPKIDPFTGEAIKPGTDWAGIAKNVGGKVKSVAKAVPGVVANVLTAPETTVPAAIEANEALLKRNLESGDTGAMNTAEGVQRLALHAATHPGQILSAITGSGDVGEKIAAPVKAAYEGAKKMFSGTEEKPAVSPDKTEKQSQPAKQEAQNTKAPVQAAQPVAEETTSPAQPYTADQIKAFEKEGHAVSEGKGGNFKYVQDEQGNIVKVDTKTGNQTVMEAPSRKGIVPGGIAEGTRQFWENQGMSADPAERRAQKEMQELRAQALQGGTGDMSWAEYANANRRQKAAQGILNNLMQSRTQQGISQANLAAAKEEKAAARIAAAAEREYQHGKDEENRKLEERKLEQAERIAGEKTGQYTLPNGEVFKGTKAQYEDASKKMAIDTDAANYAAELEKGETFVSDADKEAFAKQGRIKALLKYDPQQAIAEFSNDHAGNTKAIEDFKKLVANMGVK